MVLGLLIAPSATLSSGRLSGRSASRYTVFYILLNIDFAVRVNMNVGLFKDGGAQLFLSFPDRTWGGGLYYYL